MKGLFIYKYPKNYHQITVTVAAATLGNLYELFPVNQLKITLKTKQLWLCILGLH